MNTETVMDNIRFTIDSFKENTEMPEYFVGTKKINVTPTLSLDIDFTILPESIDLQSCIDLLILRSQRYRHKIG